MLAPAVEVLPARLHQAHRRIGKRPHRVSQQVRRRHEVGVEHEQQLAAGVAPAGLERAGLEADPIIAAQVVRVDAGGAEPGHPGRADRGGLVGGVVEHLDLEAGARPVERAHRVEQPGRDLGLVPQRQLHGHHRLVAGPRARAGAAVGDARSPRSPSARAGGSRRAPGPRARPGRWPRSPTRPCRAARCPGSGRARAGPCSARRRRGSARRPRSIACASPGCRG